MRPSLPAKDERGGRDRCANLKAESNSVIKLEGGESGKEVVKKAVDEDVKEETGNIMKSRGKSMTTRS